MDYITHPYPGELIYSTLARYARNMNISHRQHNSIIFSSNNNNDNLSRGYSIINLNRIAELMGGDITGYKLLHNNTTFLYDSAFYPILKKERMESIYLNGGKITKHFKCESLRYCPNCAKKDIEIYGEAYFHVEHHLKGILSCPTCYTPLHIYKDNDISRYIYLDINNLNSSEEWKLTNIHRDITKMAKELIENVVGPFELESVRLKIKTLLVEKHAYINRTINISEDFINEFCNFFTMEKSTMEYYGVNINDMQECITMTVLKNESRIPKTIDYISVIYYLTKDFNDFDKIRPKIVRKESKEWKCSEETLQKRRNIVEEYLEKDKCFTRRMLYKLSPYTASILNKYDKYWFDRNLPVDRTNGKMLHDEEYDKKMKDLVEESYNDLVSKDMRISIRNLALKKEIRTLLLSKIYAVNLPITRAFIDTIYETPDQYNAKKLKAAIDEFIKTGEHFTYQTVLRKVGNKWTDTKKPKEIIDSYLEDIGHRPIKLITGTKYT